jgi:hypothetical protein
MSGGSGLSRDGGKRLTEFVVQLAGKMAPLFVLHSDELSRQCVAFGERRLQFLCERVEDVGNCREFREIEAGQARGKIVRSKLRQPGADRMRRPQGACECGVYREAKPRQRESHDGENATCLAPALGYLGGRVEGRDGHAGGFAFNDQWHRYRFAGMKDGTIECGETFGGGSFVGKRTVANALAEISDIVPVGDTEPWLHQRRRDPL